MPDGCRLDAGRVQRSSLYQVSYEEELVLAWRTVADVPVGIWASGGLDSSTILHYAAAASPRPLKTFSISFAGRSFDETRYFRDVARAFGTDHHEFDFTKRIVRPDGEIRYVRCVGVPRIHGAAFQGFVGTGIDVTEQKRLTQDLQVR